MTFAFINAMHKEHEQLVQLLSNTKEKELGPFRVVEGKYGACDVVLMESGIGKVNAAIGAAELLHNYRLNAIINTGVAGGIDPTVGVMDVVVGKSVAYHDVDCGPENKPGQVQGLPLFFPASSKLPRNCPRRKRRFTADSSAAATSSSPTPQHCKPSNNVSPRLWQLTWKAGLWHRSATSTTSPS